MINKNLLQPVPTQRLKPLDGMAVTAEVWEEAHEYHRQHQQIHALWQHGSGIVAGLEVIASDPPDSAVYIYPGLAINGQGQLVMVAEPLSYDLGFETEGLVYVRLNHGEGRPRPKPGRTEDGAALFISSEFSIEATPNPDPETSIEIARIWRERGAALHNPKEPAHPGPNEIDCRYRRYVGAKPSSAVSIGVMPLGGTGDHGRGAARLAHALRGPLGERQMIWTDNNVGFSAKLNQYSLLYLVGYGPFSLAPEQMTVIYNYLKQGGTVFFEAARRETRATVAATKAFNDMLEAFGLTLESITPEHALLSEPHFFPAIPHGFEVEGTPTLKIGEGIIFSENDYGMVWSGERRGRKATREEVRAAYEWGHNLVAYVLARQQAQHS